MSASKRAASLRVPASDGTASRPPPRDARPSLRLSLSRGTLGIELDAPFSMSPLSITDLAVGLAGVRFPVDLSGGVARFRHRRGTLERLAIEARTVDVLRWAAPRLEGLLPCGSASPTPETVLAPVEGGLLIGVRRGGSALAFEVMVAPLEGDLRLLPVEARGVGLGAPPHVLAMRALAALTGRRGRPIGGAIVIADAAAGIVRELMPLAGARVPSTATVRWEAPSWGASLWIARAAAGLPPPALDARTLSALELAELSGDADALAFAGDLDGARRRYSMLLERAPRHPEISRRLAWIDLAVGDRAEAALSTLVEAMPAQTAGILGGELLRAVGDDDGARGAWGRAAAEEPYGPLAALAWLRVAELAETIDEKLHALQESVTRAPSLDLSRWSRLEARLDVADVRGARGDAEHLEAAARGPEERHAVWMRVADAYLSRGFLAESSGAFERALRYAPASATALAGLGRALRAAGQDKRSLDLFARAAAIAERRGEPAHEVTLELARGLAESAGDLPAAIARVRTVPPGVPESMAARLLEGRWRASLGDHAGAAAALGRLRDAVELSMAALSGDAAAAAAALLMEAAEIEERQREDLAAAQRHLGLAMRLRPRDRSIAAAFRRVATAATRPAAAVAPPPPAVQAPYTPPFERELESELEGARPAQHTEELDAAAVRQVLGEADLDEGDDGIDLAEAEAQVQRLTDQVRANPGDDAATVALVDLLAQLGRDMELLALVSARMEEGSAEVREALSPRRREALQRLAENARAEGREDEASLYEGMIGDAE
jgi:tetratricopeptide (TPR) repeat protein